MQRFKILGNTIPMIMIIIHLLCILHPFKKEPIHIDFNEEIITKEEEETIVEAEERVGAKKYESEVDNIEYISVTTIQIDNIIAKAKEEKAEDLRYLSAIIFAEASTQCYAGKVAVGIIVMNRSASSDFADGICNVLYQSGQFTPAANGALSKALAMYDRGEIPESCIEAAEYALSGKKTISYNGIIYDLSDYFFFSRYIKNARLTIEDHMFR